MKRLLQVWVVFGGILLSGSSLAESLVTSAKVMEVTPRGFVLMVGTEPLAVEDSVSTKFWRAGLPAQREKFAVGEGVRIRLNVATDPPSLRELADEASWTRLERLRREFVAGKVERVDAKTVTLMLDDGLPFTYRATEKSKVRLSGQAATFSDLKVGQAVFAKGRLLPSLDVWLSEISDVRPAVTPTTARKGRTAPEKRERLPVSGTLEVDFVAYVKPVKMLDVMDRNRVLHFTVSSETKVLLSGRAIRLEDLSKFQRLRIQYRRDRLGRLIALRVDVVVHERRIGELPGRRLRHTG